MGAYRLLLGGDAADDTLATLIASIEVDESLDLPGAIQLTVPVSRSSQGDLTYVSDPRFGPLAPLAVVASAGSGGGDQCIFDGYVLSQKLHIETGTTNSSLIVWGQDACWLMNRTEKVREWVDMTDSQIAASIFGDYGISPAPANGDDDSPSHTEDGHSLMQRGSDIVFLRMLARRGGKLCRVACAATPGDRTGYFAAPALDGDAAVTLTLNDQTDWPVSALDLEWDASRPSAVEARAALFSDASGQSASGDTDQSGLPALAGRTLADFIGQSTTVLLATAVDSAGELAQRARAVLRDAGWFARCEGEADVARLGAILRPGMVVALDGVGAIHSGKWLVWTVRHTITPEAHVMAFTLMRNAVGAASGAAGGLAGLLGAR